MKLELKIFIAMILLLSGGAAMSIEQPSYNVVFAADGIEYRQYEPYLVAETLMEDITSYSAAGNEGFRRLGGIPAVIRIDAVEPTGFMVRVQEWDHLDGVHALEKASYIVMERGTHQLPDGSWVEAGTVDIMNAGSYRAFVTVPLTASFTRRPVVTAAVNTVNDPQAVTVRLRGVRADKFTMMLQEGEAFDQVHATETVAFIAWEPSIGTLDGRPYEIGIISYVTHEGRDLVFDGTYASPPAFIADMQTSIVEPANIRWLNKSATSVNVWVDEE